MSTAYRVCDESHHAYQTEHTHHQRQALLYPCNTTTSYTIIQHLYPIIDHAHLIITVIITSCKCPLFGIKVVPIHSILFKNQQTSI